MLNSVETSIILNKLYQVDQGINVFSTDPNPRQKLPCTLDNTEYNKEENRSIISKMTIVLSF